MATREASLVRRRVGSVASSVVPPGRGVDAQGAAGQGDAFAYADEPEALVVGGGREAGAVVVHADRHPRVVVGDQHVDGGPCGVLDGVGQALLHEAVDRDLGLGEVTLVARPAS